MLTKGFVVKCLICLFMLRQMAAALINALKPPILRPKPKTLHRQTSTVRGFTTDDVDVFAGTIVQLLSLWGK